MSAITNSNNNIVTIEQIEDDVLQVWAHRDLRNALYVCAAITLPTIVIPIFLFWLARKANYNMLVADYNLAEKVKQFDISNIGNNITAEKSYETALRVLTENIPEHRELANESGVIFKLKRAEMTQEKMYFILGCLEVLKANNLIEQFYGPDFKLYLHIISKVTAQANASSSRDKYNPNANVLSNITGDVFNLLKPYATVVPRVENILMQRWTTFGFHSATLIRELALALPEIRQQYSPDIPNIDSLIQQAIDISFNNKDFKQETFIGIFRKELSALIVQQKAAGL